MEQTKCEVAAEGEEQQDQPRNRGRADRKPCSLGAWSAVIAQRYKTGYTDQDGVNKVKDYWIHDLSASYAATKDLLLTVGVNNVFDKDPPLTGQNTTFQRGYDPRFTDPIGRSFLLRASYKFF